MLCETVLWILARWAVVALYDILPLGCAAVSVFEVRGGGESRLTFPRLLLAVGLLSDVGD